MSFLFGRSGPNQAEQIAALKAENDALKAESREVKARLASLIERLDAPLGTEDALQHFIEHANAPICGLDLNGRINDWNRKGQETLKLPKAKVIGLDAVEVFGGRMDEQSKENLRKLFSESLQGKDTIDTEVAYEGGDGTVVDLLLNCTTRRDAKGAIIGVLAVGQDITLRKKAEQLQVRLHKELRSFIDMANAPIFGIDADGIVNEWNNKAVELTGFTHQDIVGKKLVEDYIVADYKQAVSEMMDNAMEGRETGNFELPIITKNGERLEVLLNVTSRRDVSGKVVGVVGVGQDVTERKRAELEKSRVAQELQTFIDTANAPIFGIDAQGRVNEWNHKAAEITRFPSAEVLGRDLVKDFITDNYKESVQEVLDNALKGQETGIIVKPMS